MPLFVGTDIGGTFTDVVGHDAAEGRLTFGKRLTERDDLVGGVADCLASVDLPFDRISVLKHGTTQIINILLERKGARVALVTTAGFRDLMEIGRAGRPVAFELDYRRDDPLVERENCVEIEERIDARGRIVTPLAEAELQAVAERLRTMPVDAVGVSLINAYANPVHETTVAQYLRDNLPGVFVTSGVELSREWYEYERTSTVVANAYVGPRAKGYLDDFERRLSQSAFSGLFYLMGSNGGVLSVGEASRQPVALVESGPIGGCVGAAVYAEELGIERLIAFDMGGTTAKCALVESGLSEVQDTYYVGGYERGLPLRTPVLDIVEVGTGGGSIAHVDGGRLLVGPHSAGSNPGPVCFGKGGTQPTVTDVNLHLGRISGGRFLDGGLPLDVEAARAAIRDRISAPLGFDADASPDKAAAGVLALANMQMAMAIKEITIERGKDVRDFALFAFGGGGPLHTVELARELRIPRVIVPPEPGNFSALGMLFADARVDEIQSFRMDVADLSPEILEAVIGELRRKAADTLRREFAAQAISFEHVAEMRFRGQKHSLRVPFDETQDAAAMRAGFLRAYRAKYGHVDENAPVEIIGARVAAFAPTETPDINTIVRLPKDGGSPPSQRRAVYFPSAGSRLDTPVFRREDLPAGFSAVGPAVIEEFGATTVIGPGDKFRVGRLGEIDIEIHQEREGL